MYRSYVNLHTAYTGHVLHTLQRGVKHVLAVSRVLNKNVLKRALKID